MTKVASVSNSEISNRDRPWLTDWETKVQEDVIRNLSNSTTMIKDPGPAGRPSYDVFYDPAFYTDKQNLQSGDITTTVRRISKPKDMQAELVSLDNMIGMIEKKLNNMPYGQDEYEMSFENKVLNNEDVQQVRDLYLEAGWEAVTVLTEQEFHEARPAGVISTGSPSKTVIKTRVILTR